VDEPAAPVRAGLLARVEEKATGDGRTVPNVVGEMLTAWLESKPPAEARESRARVRKGT
jgi:hypothetical protein